MNKPKTADVKKTLIRNPEQPIPIRMVTALPSKVSISSKIEVESSGLSRNSTTTVSQYKPAQKTRFNVPEMHSTLKLSKKIDEIVYPRKTKSLSEIERTKLAVDEKVARKVNIPYGKSVFKDLIPLTDKEVKVQPSVATRGRTYQKEKEPVLSDFLQPRKSKVYYHQPRRTTSYLEETKVSISTHNGLGLYELLQVNES